MKFKSVLAAAAAAAVFSTTACVAFAETDDEDKDTLAVTGANGTMVDTVADTATVDSEKSTDTGAEGVAAVLGVIALAGAAVVMSRKKA